MYGDWSEVAIALTLAELPSLNNWGIRPRDGKENSFTEGQIRAQSSYSFAHCSLPQAWRDPFADEFAKSNSPFAQYHQRFFG